MSRARIAVTSNMRSGVEPLNGHAPFSNMPIGPDLTIAAGSGVVFSAIVGPGSVGSLSMSVGSVTVVSVVGTVFDADICHTIGVIIGVEINSNARSNARLARDRQSRLRVIRQLYEFRLNVAIQSEDAPQAIP